MLSAQLLRSIRRIGMAKNLRLLVVGVLIVVFARFLSPPVASACYFYCDESGDEASCETPVNWLQYNDSYFECTIKTKCILMGLYCYTICQTHDPCLPNIGSCQSAPETWLPA
jgi:hypothetical protein